MLFGARHRVLVVFGVIWVPDLGARHHVFGCNSIVCSSFVVVKMVMHKRVGCVFVSTVFGANGILLEGLASGNAMLFWQK